MKKQDARLKRLKIYIIIIMFFMPILLFNIGSNAIDDNLYWRGGSGNVSDKSHWYKNNGYSNCYCIPQWVQSHYNNVFFDSKSGNGNVTLDINITTGNVYLGSLGIKIVILNNTKWTIDSVKEPSLPPVTNPPFDVLGTLHSAFYILIFLAMAVAFIVFAFKIRKIRGKFG